MTPEYHGEIARRAYRIWEGEGRPSGKDLEHWLRAEAEMKTARPEGGSEVPTKRQPGKAASSTGAPVKRRVVRRRRRTQTQ